ncbi:hypothetical protein Cob_v007916 [Colletotrichum orbiculare MAFF 240422]|uniref:Uncharacterized protein n=1 Tax=Colletotrichum orbiculare (strain 104-T / ATCC 96160 / CBS 514.97 / LARS 414 / MAFF 240422) TaxID=1213857 RepID=A0A484FQ72_COLOR|nr:hypothetical protein Cob_v007916 [Colletotrichum orbiculare MAFF 240422]
MPAPVWHTLFTAHWISSNTYDKLKSVEYAKILANGAVVALEESGTTSSAYRRWFGGQNAKRSTLEAIKTHHYEAVLAGLREP